MPCYGVRTVEQALADIPDINLLAKGLEEMGFKTRVVAKTIAFYGVDKTTGQYQSGSYENGKLTTEAGLNLGMLKKCVAIANVKKQVESNNSDKYKKTKLTLTKVGEFNYKVTKQ